MSSTALYGSVGAFGAVVLGSLLFCLYYRFFRIKKVKREERRMLELLPVHKMILAAGYNVESLLEVIETNLDSIHERDYHERNAFEVATAMQCDDEIVAALLKHSLPFDVHTKKERPLSEHQNAWPQVVQLDAYHNVVARLLEEYPHLNELLANFRDEKGRTIIEIATKCKAVIKESLYFLKRYKLKTPNAPHHQSATCILHMATDYSPIHGPEGLDVAIKFMRFEEQYMR